MNLSLPIHLFIHFSLSLLAGIIVWRVWKKPFLVILAALCGGFLVDFDHFIDYFLAFGGNFNLYYFEKGFSFLKSGKMYTFFHGWEYVIILLLIAVFLNNKTAKIFFLALSLGLFFHLCADVIVDKMPIASYSIIHKAHNNFDIEKLVTPEHWEKDQERKKTLGF
jgi:hypothetical protein